MSDPPIVLIACSMAEGRAWADTQPAAPRPLVVVTPHSPDAARGVSAAAVLATDMARLLPQYRRLLENCLPCVARKAAGR